MNKKMAVAILGVAFVILFGLTLGVVKFGKTNEFDRLLKGTAQKRTPVAQPTAQQQAKIVPVKKLAQSKSLTTTAIVQQPVQPIKSGSELDCSQIDQPKTTKGFVFFDYNQAKVMATEYISKLNEFQGTDFVIDTKPEEVRDVIKALVYRFNITSKTGQFKFASISINAYNGLLYEIMIAYKNRDSGVKISEAQARERYVSLARIFGIDLSLGSYDLGGGSIGGQFGQNYKKKLSADHSYPEQVDITFYEDGLLSDFYVFHNKEIPEGIKIMTQEEAEKKARGCTGNASGVRLTKTYDRVSNVWYVAREWMFVYAINDSASRSRNVCGVMVTIDQASGKLLGAVSPSSCWMQ